MEKNKVIGILLVLLAIGIFIIIYTIYDSNDNSISQNTNQNTNLNINTDKMELKKDIITEGTGDEVKSGDTVSVHYTGTLEDGTKFDSSVDRGTPFEFTVGGGQVIQGWDQGLAGMKVGEKSKLTIPAEMGYGSRDMGTIPANSNLIFEIEVLEIK